MNGKAPDAFRTISEVADWLGVNAHVLRFWESKFTQVKPVKRAGGRRYYRPSDMELLGGIQKLLHEDGMTIKGVQKVLRERGVRAVCAMSKPIDDLASADAAPVDDSPALEADAGTQAPLPPATDLPSAEETGTEEAATEDISAVAPAGDQADEPMDETTAPFAFQPPFTTEADTFTGHPPPAHEVAADDPDTVDAPSEAEPPEAPAPVQEPRGDDATMPLFDRGQDDGAPPLPAETVPAAADMAGPDAPSAPFTGETDAALPDTSHVPAATDGPVVAPLPRSEISLGEALASLSPGMIDPALLRPIHDRLVDLRRRMAGPG